jgi:exonuclease VII small subunit
MLIIQQRDFESKAGQERIVKTIHHFENKLHELEHKIKNLERVEKAIEHELEGPEVY